MGIRETLNQNPGITTGVTAGIIVLALIVIVWQIATSGRPNIPTQAYYTVDDGATYFADDINLIPPFEKDGKQAVRAHVFRCPDGKPFVAYLERYTPRAKSRLEQARNSDPADVDPGLWDEVSNTGVEVKKPGTGDKGWVRPTNYDAYTEVISPVCPDGSIRDIMPVFP